MLIFCVRISNIFFASLQKTDIQNAQYSKKSTSLFNHMYPPIFIGNVAVLDALEGLV